MHLLKDWVENSEYCMAKNPEGFSENVYEAAVEDIDEGMFRDANFRDRYKAICPNETRLCALMDALVLEFPDKFKSVTLTKGWKVPVRGWHFAFNGTLAAHPTDPVTSTVQLMDLVKLISEAEQDTDPIDDEDDPWSGSTISTFAEKSFFEVLYLNPKASRIVARMPKIDFDIEMERLYKHFPSLVRLQYISKRGTKVWACRREN